MERKLLILFFLSLIFGLENNAAASYQIVELGAHKNLTLFDKTLNWYLVITEKPLPAKKNAADTGVIFYPIQGKVIKIDLSQNIKQYLQGEGYFLELILPRKWKHAKGKFLVGTSELINDWNYKNYETSGDLPIGFQQELYAQTFRSLSPYLNLYVTGTAELSHYQVTTADYTLDISCDFETWSNYQVTSFGNEDLKSRESFVQPLTPLLFDFLAKDSAFQKLENVQLFHIGYLDGDWILDMIIETRGYKFLFLSGKHDFENKKIFHLEKAWKTEHSYEF